MDDCAIADQYTWVAIDREFRRVISHVLEKRNANNARVIPGQRIITFRACSRLGRRHTEGNSDEYIICGGLHSPHPISVWRTLSLVTVLFLGLLERSRFPPLS